jgi:hypothetical protein
MLKLIDWLRPETSRKSVLFREKKNNYVPPLLNEYWKPRKNIFASNYFHFTAQNMFAIMNLEKVTRKNCFFMVGQCFLSFFDSLSQHFSDVPYFHKSTFFALIYKVSTTVNKARECLRKIAAAFLCEHTSWRRVARFFLVQTYQNGGNMYTKWT